MADEKNLKLAKETFATLCRMLENAQWKFNKDEENLKVKCGAQGDDLPIELNIDVDAERMLTIVVSMLPMTIQEDKRLDIAIAITAINNVLANGSFDYDVLSGRIFFRMVNSFCDSVLGEELFAYMVYASCKIVDEYNDKLLMLAKGMLSIEQFLADVNS